MSLGISSYCRFLIKRKVLQSANSASFNQSVQQWKSKKKDTDGEKISDEMKEAVKNVAKSVPGDEQKTEKDLLGSLLRRSQSQAIKRPQVSKTSSDDEQHISKLLMNMKINTNVSEEKEDEKLDVSSTLRLFEGPDLGIFNPDTEEKVQYETTGEVYDRKQSLRYALEREKFEAMSIASIPTNGFQEMINWTKEGKLWNFPINNEFGKEDLKVGFEEHVFLETEIKDFPRKGPIRHFIELVAVGLSRNPHISAKSKRNHINWFREYFKSKSKVLEESLGDASKFTERESNSVKEQKSIKQDKC